MLQPLVENSVRHAVAVRIEPGLHRDPRAPRRHEPGARRSRQRPGHVAARLARTRAKGVGLANTRSRLERLYGANHQLLFEEPPGGGLDGHGHDPVPATRPSRRDATDDFAEDIKGVA